jgi:hypothetical protein
MSATRAQRSAPSARSWTGASVALAALALACSGEDERPPLIDVRSTPSGAIDGCEDHEYGTCDIRAESCQSRLFALMRCAYGVDDGAASAPSMSVLTREQAFEYLSAEPEEASPEDPSDFDASIRARENLGMIEAGIVGSDADLLELTLEGVAGLYLYTTREIIVIDQGEPMDDFDANMTLGHELVHSLQDQVHDLGTMSASIEQTSDAALGLASLVEGEASFYELQLALAYQGRSMGEVDFDLLLDAADDASRELGSPALTARLIFPYTYGTTFVADLWRAGGRESLSAAFGQPPRDTLEIIEGGPALRAPVDAGPAPLDGYVAVEEDVVGAWLMAATLAELSGDRQQDLASLASSWRGDRLFVYRESAGEGIVVDWLIQASDPDTARRLAEVYQGWRPPAGELALRVDGNELHIAVSDASTSADSWLARWSGTQ